MYNIHYLLYQSYCIIYLAAAKNIKKEINMSGEEIFNRIEYIKYKLDSEYEFSLSTKQIMNIAKELSKYELPDIKDYLIALEYACKMRIQILNHIEHCESMYQKRFNSFNNISYVVKRALSVIGKVEPVKPIDIKYLEINVEYLEREMNIAKNGTDIEKLLLLN